MATDPAAEQALHYDRFLAHPPEKVWEALTNPDDLRQWMGADSVVLEGRVGGRFVLDGLVRGEGRVLAWRPPEVLEHDFRLSTPAGRKEGGVVTYHLRPEGTGTRLTMTFRSASPTLAGLFKRGQATTFDRLEAVLDRKARRQRSGEPDR